MRQKISRVAEIEKGASLIDFFKVVPAMVSAFLSASLLVLPLIFLRARPALSAAPAVRPGMKSFGTAVKQAELVGGYTEKTVFEHEVSPNATHGAITQQWHAGVNNMDLVVKIYIDGEVTASIQYEVGHAHGAGPAQVSIAPEANATAPWSAGESFGRTHESGFWNTWLVPFRRTVRVTLMTPRKDGLTFWYMVRGVENAPLVVSGLELPSETARLRVIRTTTTVAANSLVTWAFVSGTAGLFRQLNLVVNSSAYTYQEGCVSARIDGGGSQPGGTDLWLSSGLEDYFLGAYFHSMDTQHLPFSGFQLGAVAEPPGGPPATRKDPVTSNALAAYRIHEKDPIHFSNAFELFWVASHDNADKENGWCNYDWPATPLPSVPSTPARENGEVSVDALAWVYTY